MILFCLLDRFCNITALNLLQTLLSVLQFVDLVTDGRILLHLFGQLQALVISAVIAGFKTIVGRNIPCSTSLVMNKVLLVESFRPLLNVFDSLAFVIQSAHYLLFLDVKMATLTRSVQIDVST